MTFLSVIPGTFSTITYFISNYRDIFNKNLWNKGIQGPHTTFLFDNSILAAIDPSSDLAVVDH